MPTTTDRALTVQEAYDAIDAFGQSAGRLRLLLLLHAAVPQSFRADLLNLLKANFLAEEAGTDLTIDVDVLLSPLVQPAAAGYYRFDPEVRRQAVALLDAAYRKDRERRSVRVARLVLAYADAVERDAGQVIDPLLAEYLAVQRWVALAFVDPTAAAEGFAKALSQTAGEGQAAAKLRLGSVTSALSIPLGGHRELLAYARGVEAIAAGDVERGHRLLDWVGDEVAVGAVTLKSPVKRAPAWRQPEPPRQQTVPQAEAATEASEDRVVVSFALDDIEAAGALIRALRLEGIETRTTNSGPIAETTRAEVERAVELCTLFVPLLSRWSAANDYCRLEWEVAHRRAARLRDSARFIVPVALERLEAGVVPDPMARINWHFTTGSTVEEMTETARVIRTALIHRRADRLFGVLSPPVAIVGREQPLSVLGEWVSRPASRTSAPVLAIVGEDGLGKWTLANHFVDRYASRFPDGVVWFGDEGSGDPRQALKQWAEANGVADLFVGDVVDPDRFARVFAERRALFVVDHRAASDIAPILRLAGPRCAVLRLMNGRPSPETEVIVLDALPPDAATELLSRGAKYRLQSGELLDFASGSPLLLKLLGGLVTYWEFKEVVEHLKLYEGARADNAGLSKTRWAVEFVWRKKSDLDAVRTLILASRGSSTLPSAELPSINLSMLEQLGWITRHSDSVRIPPAIGAALRELERSSTSIGDQPSDQSKSGTSGYVPGFKHDIFLSVARADEEWVGPFRYALEAEMSRRLGLAIRIWRDSTNAELGQIRTREIDDAVAQSAVLLAVVSPSYQRSDFCTHEREVFGSQFSSKADFSASGRFFAAIKTPPEDRDASWLATAQILNFFGTEKGRGDVEFAPGSPEFTRALDRLAKVIVGRLRRLRRADPPAGARATVIQPMEPITRQIELGNFDAAHAMLEERLLVTREHADRPEEAITLGRLAFVAEERGEFGRSLDIHRQRRRIYEELGDNRGAAAVMTSLGRVQLIQGQLLEARETFAQAVFLQDRAEDRLGTVEALLELATVQRFLGESGETMRTLERALERLGDYAAPGALTWRVRILNDMSAAALQTGDVSRALSFSDEALRWAHESDDVGLRISALACRADVSSQIGNLQEADAKLDEAQALATKTKNGEWLVRVRLTKAWLQAGLGDASRARALFAETWPPAQNMTDRILFATSAERYGLLELAIGERERANEILKQAADFYATRKMDDDAERVAQLLRLGDITTANAELTRRLRSDFQSPPRGGGG